MKKKKIETTETVKPVTPKVHRDGVRKSNSTLAKMIRNGEIDRDNWEYIVRKMGYNVKAVKVLLGDEF